MLRVFSIKMFETDLPHVLSDPDVYPTCNQEVYHAWIKTIEFLSWKTNKSLCISKRYSYAPRPDCVHVQADLEIYCLHVLFDRWHL